MALVLNPPPGLYSAEQTINVTGPSNVDYVLYSTDGSDPIAVRTVAASDKFTPPRPYMQTADDSRGRIVFDGSFPKYYNTNWNAGWTSFSQLSRQFKYLYNALNYIRNGGTRWLLLGDRAVQDGGQYRLKGVNSSDFVTSLSGLGDLMGFTYTFKDRYDYPDLYLDPTPEELANYDFVFFLGSYYTTTAWITDAGAQALAQARRNGMGFYFCTDHGIIGGIASYTTPNKVLQYMISGAQFSGDYNFNPGTTVAYNRAMFGDSPLFNGLADTDLLPASGSDSNVEQTAAPPSPLPLDISLGEGTTTIKFAIVDTGGNVTFEQYQYTIVVNPPGIKASITGTIDPTTRSITVLEDGGEAEITNYKYSEIAKFYRKFSDFLSDYPDPENTRDEVVNRPTTYRINVEE